MLQNFRGQKIIWNNANMTIHGNIIANTGDISGRKLVVQIKDGKDISDLTGYTLQLSWEKVLDTFTAVDIKKGIFELYYTKKMLKNSGNIDASLVLSNSNSKIESKRFKIKIIRQVI